MAIAFLDLAASIPTKASVYSTMACPPCAEDRLGPPEQPSSRIVGRATSSAAERTYGHTAFRDSGNYKRWGTRDDSGALVEFRVTAASGSARPRTARGATVA